MIGSQSGHKFVEFVLGNELELLGKNIDLILCDNQSAISTIDIN